MRVWNSTSAPGEKIKSSELRETKQSFVYSKKNLFKIEAHVYRDSAGGLDKYAITAAYTARTLTAGFISPDTGDSFRNRHYGNDSTQRLAEWLMYDSAGITGLVVKV